MLVKVVLTSLTNETLLGGCYNDSINEVNEALTQGADVNVESSFETGMRPLMISAGHDDVAIVKVLLAHGVNTDLKNENGITADELTRNKTIKALILESRAKHHRR